MILITNHCYFTLPKSRSRLDNKQCRITLSLASMQKLGKYVLTRKLGAGGMGVVYEGHDPTLNRSVAIKLLPADRGPDADIRRFELEAEAAAQVHHPNCVTIFEIGEDAGRPFIVMELVRGLNAGELVERSGPPPWADATLILVHACRGLTAIHEKGLVHRDVKPSNLLISAAGEVKLADFGLAKSVGRMTQSLSGEGTVGTPHFMSPEQCWSETVDLRTDIYALGATYYALLTGRPPFQAARDLQVMFAHCNNPVPDPRDVRPELPAGCSDVIRKAMAKAPADRYQTAAEMQAALEAIAAAGAPTDSLVAATTHDLPPLSLTLPTTATFPRPGVTRRRALLAIPPALVAIGAGIVFSVRGCGGSRPDDAHAKGTETNGTGGGNVGTTDTNGAGGNPPDADPPIRDGTVWDIGGPVRAVAISDDSRWVALGMAGKENERGVRLYDRKSPGREPVLSEWKNLLCPDVAFSPDGRLLAAAGGVRVMVWSVTARRELEWLPTKPYSPVGAVAFSPDGQLLAAAMNSWGTEKDQPVVRLWRVTGNTGTHLRDLNARSAPVRRLSFSPDGKSLAACVGSGAGMTTTRPTNQILVWNLDDASFTALPTPGVGPGPGGVEIRPNAVFARKEWALAVARRDTINVYLSPSLGKQRQPWSPRDEPLSLAPSPDGRLLAVALADGIHLYDTVSGQVRGVKHARHTGPVLAMTFTADGRHLVSAGYHDNTVRFWEVPS
jgi:serine/threonine protein kinase